MDETSSAGVASAQLAWVTTSAGQFTVLVGDGSYGGHTGTGLYRIVAEGIQTGLTLCRPVITGSALTVGAVGGTPAGRYVLHTSTNVTGPFNHWRPVVTNQFDSFGLMDYQGEFDKLEAQRFFRIVPQ
ncbi:MAG: hypothetical protein JNN07_13360 [Verrucomicrobiales bacterium]|nr:hypothetical protein [Verrucomicrobiales bacterium]